MDYSKLFNSFIHSGDTVCEVFYGNRPDLIPLLSLAVQSKGIVFAIDKYPAVTLIPNLEIFIKRLPFQNVIFLKATIPPLPKAIERNTVHAFIFREFIWAYIAEHGGPLTGESSPITTMISIDTALKKNGFIILFDPVQWTEMVLKQFDKAFPQKYKMMVQEKEYMVLMKV